MNKAIRILTEDDIKDALESILGREPKQYEIDEAYEHVFEDLQWDENLERKIEETIYDSVVEFVESKIT